MSEEKTTMQDPNNPFNLPAYVPDLSPKAKVDASAIGGGSSNVALDPKPELQPSATGESAEARTARLRRLAQIEIDAETDADLVKQMVTDERARRAQELLPIDTSGFPADYVRVTVALGQGKHDLSYVPLSINGYCIKVPRGREVILPRIFVDECLEHAIEEITEQSQGGLITRPVHRFPYSIKGSATTAEYQAFVANQRALAERQLGGAARPMSA